MQFKWYCRDENFSAMPPHGVRETEMVGKEYVAVVQVGESVVLKDVFFLQLCFPLVCLLIIN